MNISKRNDPRSWNRWRAFGAARKWRREPNPFRYGSVLCLSQEFLSPGDRKIRLTLEVLEPGLKRPIEAFARDNSDSWKAYRGSQLFLPRPFRKLEFRIVDIERPTQKFETVYDIWGGRHRRPQGLRTPWVVTIEAWP
jgi:hypothetical protein